MKKKLVVSVSSAQASEILVKLKETNPEAKASVYLRKRETGQFRSLQIQLGTGSDFKAGPIPNGLLTVYSKEHRRVINLNLDGVISFTVRGVTFRVEKPTLEALVPQTAAQPREQDEPNKCG